jgi:signal transduction histidine kinase/putative methionine-R-sulfoxide reductase with GAF domain
MQPRGPPLAERSAAVLRDRQEDLVERWEDAVRKAPAGPRLEGPSLRDHVTEILDRVASILAPRSGPDGDPRDHGRTRASQGVGVVPVLVELGILRQVVLDAWAADGALEIQAVRALDRVLDESAIEAARRITESHEQFFRGIDAISRASLEAGSTDELLRKLLEEIVRTSAAVDAAAIFLRQGDELVVRAAVGSDEEFEHARPLRVGQGFLGTVAAEARPIVVDEPEAHPLPSRGELVRGDLRVVYGVPLVRDGEVIGVAEMGSLHAHQLKPEDRRLFESMASRAALAVARQLALDEDRRHREELALLSRLSRSLVERMDLEERLQRAAEALVPALADCCAVVLVEEGKPRRIALQSTDAGREAISREIAEIPVDPQAARGLGRVLREGTAECVADVQAELGDDPAWKEEARALFRRAEVRSYLVVPLSIPSGIIGALALGRKAHRAPFDESSRELVLEIGGRIAVAVENARLFANARREALLRERVLAVVSHDLRNPLSAVVMGAARIEGKDTGREDLLRVTGAIRRAARRMERLIADLVDASVIQSGRLSVSPQPHAPGELVREAVDAMKPHAQERGLSLGTTAAPDLPPVLADRDRVLQVLGNLLSNALDVTPPGGRIDVRAEIGEGAVRFSVSDTGPGLAPGEAERVFEPYRRGSAAAYKGTGLGLAIASGIVAAHRGEIGVESRAGKGATFWFTLPLADGAAASQPAPQ